MPIFKDSYETTVGSVFVTKPIELAIKEAMIKNGLDNINLNVKHSGEVMPVFVTGLLDSENNIPLFTHPITVFNGHSKKYLATDLRLFIRKDSDLANIEAGVKNLTEYNFTKSRAILNLLWLNDGISQIKNSLSFAGVVFAAWLSETISKAYALDFKDQTTLAIITSFYYQSLFYEQSVFDEDTKQKMAAHTIKATRAPANFVFEVFDKIGEIHTVEDYCTNVVSILENVRLKNFNLAMLLTIARNSWYGTNAKEIITVSLEHPPTWIAIVYTSLNEKTFKSSMIYRVAERFGKRGAADEFNDSYNNLIKGQLSTATESAYDVFKPFE